MTLYQWRYDHPNGRHIILGNGTPYFITEHSGLDGYDQLRTSTTVIPRGHGGSGGEHHLDVRTVTMRAMLVARNAEELAELRAGMYAALVPSIRTDGQLIWQRAGEPERLLWCRPIAVPSPSNVIDAERQANVAIALEAADPRLYSLAEHQSSLTPYTTNGGVNNPVNGAKNATASGNDTVASNGGNSDAPLTVQVYGPTSGTCTGVQLINRTTGVTFDVQTDIVAGQILTVDMRAEIAATGGRVIELSGAGRYGSWQQPRTPIVIAPGSNVLRFTADGDTTGMRAVVKWRDTWIS